MKIILTVLVISVIGLTAAFAAGEHPVEMGKKECITCHSDADVVGNPAIVDEWNKSLHSYSGVNCGNCHGDEANFKAVPRKDKCAPCHEAQVAKVNSVLPCARCHPTHTFSAHK